MARSANYLDLLAWRDGVRRPRPSAVSVRSPTKRKSLSSTAIRATLSDHYRHRAGARRMPAERCRAAPERRYLNGHHPPRRDRTCPISGRRLPTRGPAAAAG
ncbi:hypothetical protein FRACA_30047 [Frankia canadensis]|uniref:Uncharacterized protein n=1 Tax=Frankia canadensis TaxID=1836972 RepID=A0A2I2KTP6_9ACTN|nr:hypothetical protein FRACA_30047 [Frankia canadensis]SOU56334.1 hypothetical protein FRACA_30047 [Frankia canadensis]